MMLNKIEWNDEYLLGINEIDNQHKKLLKIANELYDLIVDSEEAYKNTLSVVLKKLTDYTIYHFSNEEAFMSEYGYTGTATHKISHDSFIAEVNSQIKLLTTANKESAEKFYVYIVNWVLMHIAKADKIWAKFVKPQLN